jgi:hypothetical protein
VVCDPLEDLEDGRAVDVPVDVESLRLAESRVR